MKIKRPAGKSERQNRLAYMAKQVEAMNPQLKDERPRKPAKREALLMIERKTGEKVGKI